MEQSSTWSQLELKKASYSQNKQQKTKTPTHNYRKINFEIVTLGPKNLQLLLRRCWLCDESLRTFGKQQKYRQLKGSQKARYLSDQQHAGQNHRHLQPEEILGQGELQFKHPQQEQRRRGRGEH